MTQRKAVLVMGAGDATGGAIARRFAREGYVRASPGATRRSWSRWCRPFATKAARLWPAAATHARSSR